MTRSPTRCTRCRAVAACIATYRNSTGGKFAEYMCWRCGRQLQRTHVGKVRLGALKRADA